MPLTSSTLSSLGPEVCQAGVFTFTSADRLGIKDLANQSATLLYNKCCGTSCTRRVAGGIAHTRPRVIKVADSFYPKPYSHLVSDRIIGHNAIRH